MTTLDPFSDDRSDADADADTGTSSSGWSFPSGALDPEYPPPPFESAGTAPVHDPVPEPAPSTPHAQRIGVRLRRIRNQQQLSLADVEARSGGRWKAVVVGAYERGDRAVNVERLAQLADFYGVPLTDLLPDPTEAGRAAEADRDVLDLLALEGDAPGLAAIARFAEHVQQRRGDRNGQVLTLRGGDLETVALTVGEPVGLLRTALRERGALLDLERDPPATRRAR